jgi:hypothetical protein
MFNRILIPAAAIISVAFSSLATAQDWPSVTTVDRQPLLAAAQRVVTALDSVGRPLSATQITQLEKISQLTDDGNVVEEIQKLLDPLCVAAIHINAESRVKVIEGSVEKSLVQNGWQTFLVKVHNEAGINPALRCSSPQAKPQFVQSNSSPEPKPEITLADVKDRWLDIALPTREPMKATLSGLALEYRIIQLHSRDEGKREATLAFNIGQGTQDLGFRNEVAILFDCHVGRTVAIDVRDKNAPGDPMMVALEVRDSQGRVYPNPARRLAPDFFFHNQIYRKGGESLSLPEGTFDVRISRGPEFMPLQTKLVVGGENPVAIQAQLERWIDPTVWNWYSGDHHIHAAGCAHYQNPTEGVGPDDMMRHVLGEDLKVGCVLSWGPCWYTQKKFFDGKPSSLSTPNYLMRYDVEVSGFPSSHAGHLCLLRLSEDDYPGTTRLEQWPSWTLPVLKWGQRQGGVVGYSHSGWGLALPDYLPNGKRAGLPANQFAQARGGRAADQLPDYAMPQFDGIGANEFIVSVAHHTCDFISTVDTPAIWELNIWYHTLNCGFRSRISGETDFPCIYGDRVGLGRVYVQLNPDEDLDFDAWVNGLKDGRSYCGDGMSHVLKFEARDISENENARPVRMGWPGSGDAISQLDLKKPGKVRFETSIAALLEPQPSERSRTIRSSRLDAKPYWHIERCRVIDSRNVKAELIVNGLAVETKEILADGSIHDITWDVELTESSWVAVRILPSVHTNPIFVEVAGNPIRASRKSAQWCRKAVDVCWNSKKNQIRDPEKEAAKLAYDQAAEIFDEIIKASKTD